jgi:hypothetical protein
MVMPGAALIDDDAAADGRPFPAAVAANFLPSFQFQVSRDSRTQKRNGKK